MSPQNYARLDALPLRPSPSVFIQHLVCALCAFAARFSQHSPHTLLQNVRICYNPSNKFAGDAWCPARQTTPAPQSTPPRAPAQNEPNSTLSLRTRLD